MKNLLLTTLCIAGLHTGTAQAQSLPAPALPDLHNIEISGNITFADKPVANIQVEVLADGCSVPLDGIAQAKTDQHGHYRIILPRTSRYRQIAVNGYKSGSSNPRYATNCAEDGRIELFQDNEKKHHDIFLQPASPEERECITNGGRWAIINGSKACNIAYPDAGKPCTDDAQCISKRCLNELIEGTSDTNFCSRNTDDDMHAYFDVNANGGYYDYNDEKVYYTTSARLAAALKAREPDPPVEREQPSGWWFQQVSPTIDDTQGQPPVTPNNETHLKPVSKHETSSARRMVNAQGYCPPPEKESCYTENGSLIVPSALDILYAAPAGIIDHLRPVPLSPKDTTTIKSPVYTWRPNGYGYGYENYDLMLENNNGLVFTTKVTASAAGCASSGNCTFRPDKTLAVGHYSWWVSANSSNNLRSISGDSISFTVK